jgi:SAM-dependent methyltransferase
MSPSPASKRAPSFQRHYPYRLTPCSTRDYVDMCSRILRDMQRDRPRILHCGCRYGEVSLALAAAYAVDVVATEENTEGLLYARMVAGELPGPGGAHFRYMSPAHLDATDGSIDLVLLDGVLATQGRQKILREALRVLAPDGWLMVVDLYWLKTPPPAFVAAVWDAQGYKTPDKEQFIAVIEEAGFVVTEFADTSSRLESFYAQFSDQVRSIAAGGFEGMKHHKALVKQYKHEIDVYRKNGGDAFMGCGVFLARPAAHPSETTAIDPPATDAEAADANASTTADPGPSDGTSVAGTSDAGEISGTPTGATEIPPGD